METYNCSTSYADSDCSSSPSPREIVEFDNTLHNHHHQQQLEVEAKLLCSYGGEFRRRANDNQLIYHGGETKIIAVDRNITYADFIMELSSVCGVGSNNNVLVKYQLPTEDPSTLVSVTDDDDLMHMLEEYDLLNSISSEKLRMRLFLFRPAPRSTPPTSVKKAASFKQISLKRLLCWICSVFCDFGITVLDNKTGVPVQIRDGRLYVKNPVSKNNTLKPFSTKQINMRKFQRRLHRTRLPTVIAIEIGGICVKTFKPEDFIIYKRLVFKMDDNGNFVVDQKQRYL